MPAKIITPQANAQISTAQSKFGGASCLLDGTDDYLAVTYDSTLEPGSGDFTFDCWFYIPNAVTDNSTLFAYHTDFHIGVFLFGSGANNNKAAYYASSNGSSWNLISADSGPLNGLGSNTFTRDAWHHLAFVRNGNNWLGFLDGVADLNITVSGTVVSRSETFDIGRWGANVYFLNGYVDELRYSNVARWTSGFTPPTAAYNSDTFTQLLLHMDGTNGSTTFTDNSPFSGGLTLLLSDQ